MGNAEKFCRLMQVAEKDVQLLDERQLLWCRDYLLILRDYAATAKTIRELDTILAMILVEIKQSGILS